MRMHQIIIGHDDITCCHPDYSTQTEKKDVNYMTYLHSKLLMNRQGLHGLCTLL